LPATFLLSRSRYAPHTIASGPYQTAHHALGSGFMQLGFVRFELEN
jgi:hypothetical protein